MTDFQMEDAVIWTRPKDKIIWEANWPKAKIILEANWPINTSDWRGGGGALEEIILRVHLWLSNPVFWAWKVTGQPVVNPSDKLNADVALGRIQTQDPSAAALTTSTIN